MDVSYPNYGKISIGSAFQTAANVRLYRLRIANNIVK